MNSGPYNGLTSAMAQQQIGEAARERGCGQPGVSYRLRDWLISRQRFWGAPIPLVHCERCQVVPVPHEQLPVLLPTGVVISGRGSTLAQLPDWYNTSCPK